MNPRSLLPPPPGNGAHKRRVRDAFSAAAETYDGASALQREVAARLADWVMLQPPPSDASILEIGCGTGHLTRRLFAALADRRWLVTDLAAPMLDRCRATLDAERVRGGGDISFRVMDGEWPDVPPGSFDRIVSSLAFQWFDDLGGALDRLFTCLRPGGHLVFATLGADTFKEWRACLAKEGTASGIRHYPTTSDLPQAATLLAEYWITIPHPGGHAFLESLKLIGARVAAPGHHPLPAGTLRRALHGFDGSVTYHVLCCKVVRPQSNKPG